MDAPVLDRDHLARYTGGEAALEAELFSLLEAQIDACISALADAAQAAEDGANSADVWARAAHTLKGAARGVGAMKLGEACEAAEAHPLDPAALTLVRETGEEARAAMIAAQAAA
jgi:HPt (histidine-containing phosphotransfer) domain-containing protein